jgi:hypothetical protein
MVLIKKSQTVFLFLWNISDVYQYVVIYEKQTQYRNSNARFKFVIRCNQSLQEEFAS